MKARRSFIASALALSVTFSACSSDDSTTPSTAVEQSTVDTATAQTGPTSTTAASTVGNSTVVDTVVDPDATTEVSTSASDSVPAPQPEVPLADAIDIDAAIEASREEGSLLIYGQPNDNQMAPIVEAFTAKYDWIDVQYVSLGGSEVFQRYLSESSTGGPTADVVVVSEAVGMLDLVDRGEIVDYVDPTVADLPAYAQLAPGVVAMSEDPLIAVFNKAILPEDQQPTTLAELADYSADNSGRVATYTIENAFGYAANFAYLAKNGEDGWTVLDALGPNTKAEESAATTVNKIAQGEYTAAYFQSGAVRALMTGPGSEVLNWSYLTDATPIIPRGIAVTSAAASPNAAQVFVNFVLSVEGQTAACAGGFTPYRDGVECEFDLQSIIDAVGEDNLLIGSFDPEMATEQQSIIDRWNQAFGRG